ncbi:hypothetical protein [Streptomyces reniochalinae]|uniref:Uncharacterized protein n=1 Tax=Streptomyces reniochalinae TaxID=2250578 RepID=A0A367EA59_9ACTN|nr:hypothetical protein [Streptomyces reniochalinae]RCG14944.1 hypothetical protein DQ392_28195 [Streptomyces reniochalinae]
MTCPEPTWASIRSSEQLADTPAVRRGERWWLVAPSGATPADEPALTRELDSLAADMNAANRAVAHLGIDEPDQGLE